MVFIHILWLNWVKGGFKAKKIIKFEIRKDSRFVSFRFVRIRFVTIGNDSFRLVVKIVIRFTPTYD